MKKDMNIYIRQAIYLQRNIEARSRNHCCSEKEISITYSESVFVAFVIQQAMRLRRIILSSVACLPVPYFSHYLIHGTAVGRTLLNIKCVVTFSTTFVQNISHSKKKRAQYHKCT
jgi:hypothetical protein